MIVGGMRRRALWIISLVAIVHGAFYVVYLRPEWDTAWSDREGYVRLGAALAETGRFTRYPDCAGVRSRGHSHARLPGVRRGRSIGCSASATTSRSPPRRSRSLPLLCLLVYAITQRIASERAARRGGGDDRAVLADPALRRR